jgi:hypothetical protein
VLDCQAGTPVVVDDGIACTVDICVEHSSLVFNDPDSSLCDDFDGHTIDFCDPGIGCVSTPAGLEVPSSSPVSLTLMALLLGGFATGVLGRRARRSL